MQTRRNTWPALALAASVTVLPLLGCDTSTGQADQRVLDGVNAQASAHTADQADENIKKLEALSKEADASVARRAIAKAALAAAEMDSAKLTLAELQQTESEINRLLWEIEQIGGQMRSIKTAIDGAKLRDPAKPLAKEFQGETTVAEALSKRAAAAKQGDQPWIGSDKAALANAAQTKAKIDDLTGKIGKIKGEIDTLSKQRDAAAADAGKAEQESSAAKGEESTKAHLRAVELRKQAAMLNIQIEAAQASLVPLTQDLTAAQAHEKQVTAAAAAFDNAAKIHADEYARLNRSIEEMTAAAKGMLETDKGSIKAKATQINELVTKSTELRATAVERLKSAVAHYADAVKDSDAVKASIKTDAQSGTPEAMLVDLRTKVHEASNLRLRQAEASTMLGAVHAAYAAQLARRISVAQYAAAGAVPLQLSIPAELADGKAEDQLKEARTAAEEAFTSADELVQNVADGATGSQATRVSARLQRAVVALGRATLATAAGDTEGARKLKNDATGYQKEAEADLQGVAVPTYLMILTDTLPKTAAPATAPARPAAAPATPAAPAAPAPTTPVENP